MSDIKAETQYQAEESECAHRVLDDLGTPRELDGQRLSLVGRIQHMSTLIRRQVREFHNAAGVVTPETPQLPEDERIKLRVNLVTEEFCEFLTSVYPQFKDMQHGAVLFRLKQAMEYMPPKVDLVAMADALADLDYVVEGTRLVCGIDGGPVAEEVHRSNMTKFGPGSWKREDGKVMKPPDWQPPDIEGVLRKQGMV